MYAFQRQLRDILGRQQDDGKTEMTPEEVIKCHNSEERFPPHVVLKNDPKKLWLHLDGIDFGKDTVVEYNGPYLEAKRNTAREFIHAAADKDLKAGRLCIFEDNNVAEITTRNIGNVSIRENRMLQSLSSENAYTLKVENNPKLEEIAIAPLFYVNAVYLNNNPKLKPRTNGLHFVDTGLDARPQHMVTDGDTYIFNDRKGSKDTLINHFDLLARTHAAHAMQQKENSPVFVRQNKADLKLSNAKNKIDHDNAETIYEASINILLGKAEKAAGVAASLKEALEENITEVIRLVPRNDDYQTVEDEIKDITIHPDGVTKSGPNHAL